jgi:hypothetical protein
LDKQEKLRAGQSGIRFVAAARDFSLLRNIHPASYSVGSRVDFLGVKRLGHEVNHSRPSSAVVENEWSYISSLSIRLHGVDRHNFTFTFALNKKYL